jgi:hypothetical protein
MNAKAAVIIIFLVYSAQCFSQGKIDQSKDDLKKSAKRSGHENANRILDLPATMILVEN